MSIISETLSSEALTFLHKNNAIIGSTELDECSMRSTQIEFGPDATYTPRFLNDEETVSVRAAKIDPRVLERGSYRNTYENLFHATRQGFIALKDRLSTGNGQSIFIGTTSRIEDHILTSDAMKILIKSICSTQEGKERLVDLIQNGPEDGRGDDKNIVWSNPTDMHELVASVCRHIILANGKKSRIRVSEDVRGQVRDTLNEFHYEWPRTALGGVAAFATQLARAFGHKPLMHALRALPKGILDGGHLHPDTMLLTDDGVEKTLVEQVADSSKDSPGHFTVSLQNFEFPEELWGVVCRGHVIDDSHHYNSELLITGAVMPRGWHIPHDILKRVGEKNSVSLSTGYQYLSEQEEVNEYINGLQLLKSGGSLVCFEYSPHRHEDKALFIDSIKKLREVKLGSIAFNTSEAFDLLSEISERDCKILGMSDDFCKSLSSALKIGRQHRSIEPDFFQYEDSTEAPEWLFRSAVLLQELLQSSYVRVRGKLADVGITKKLDDPDIVDWKSVQLDATFSRIVAKLKVGIEGGNIRTKEDIVSPGIDISDDQLIAHEDLCDVVEESLEHSGLAPLDREEIRERLWNNRWVTLPNNQVVVLATTQDFYVRDGGTQSAGDTMAVIFYTEAADELRKIA